MYKVEIMAAIHALRSAGSPLSIATVTKQMADYIIRTYDNKTSLIICKTVWCNKVGNVFKELKINYV